MYIYIYRANTHAMDYSAYGGFDSIDVSDLAAPAIVVGGSGGRPSATTVSGRLRQMFSAVPKSDSMGKMYFAGPIKVKKMSSSEQVQNARRLAKVGAAISERNGAAAERNGSASKKSDVDLTALDDYADLSEMADDENAWYGSGEEIEINVAPVEPHEPEGLLDGL